MTPVVGFRNFSESLLLLCSVRYSSAARNLNFTTALLMSRGICLNHGNTYKFCMWIFMLRISSTATVKHSGHSGNLCKWML